MRILAAISENAVATIAKIATNLARERRRNGKTGGCRYARRLVQKHTVATKMTRALVAPFIAGHAVTLPAAASSARRTRMRTRAAPGTTGTPSARSRPRSGSAPRTRSRATPAAVGFVCTGTATGICICALNTPRKSAIAAHRRSPALRMSQQRRMWRMQGLCAAENDCDWQIANCALLPHHFPALLALWRSFLLSSKNRHADSQSHSGGQHA